MAVLSAMFASLPVSPLLLATRVPGLLDIHCLLRVACAHMTDSDFKPVLQSQVNRLHHTLCVIWNYILSTPVLIIRLVLHVSSSS